MNIMSKYSQKKATITFFFIIFLVGIINVKNYGVSSDEYSSRLKGFITLNYIGEKIAPKLLDKFKKDKEISLLHEANEIKYYGVLFEAPAAFLEVLFKIDKKKDQFLFKHYLIFIIFFFSLIFFYKLLNNRFQNYQLSLLGVLMIFLSPRIFANSFYNNKDIIFLSFFIFSLYYAFCFLDKPNNKNIILSALFCAFAIDIRINAIITPLILLIYYFLYEIINKKEKIIILKNLGKYLFYTFIFITIFWPYLWSNPIFNFLEAFKQMSNYPLEIYNLFNGKYVLSKDLPISYLPTWIFFTTPITYVLFFLIGILFLLREILYDKNILFNKNFLKDFLLFSILFSVFFIIIFLGSTLYNGWRQLYFLYPLIVYFSIFGVFRLLKILPAKTFYIIPVIFLISFLHTTYWMLKNNPYQYVYFNFLAEKNFNKKFEMDYWGLSYKQNIEYLLKYQKEGQINLFNLSDNKLYNHLMIFEDSDRLRINVVDSQKEADYLITNFQYFYSKTFKNQFNLNKYEILNEITVDGISINTLLKNN